MVYQTPTFLVGYHYLMAQPAQMQVVTGNSRKTQPQRRLQALNGFVSSLFLKAIVGKEKKDHPRHLTSKPAGLKYRQFPANSPEPLDQGVQHPDL